MKPPTKPKTWKDHVRPITAKVQPVVRVVERIATLGVHIQKATPLAMFGLASAGISTLHDLISQPEREGWVLDILFSRGYALEAFRNHGAQIRSVVHGDGGETNYVTIHGITFVIGVDGDLVLGAAPDAEFLEWLRQIFDQVLPQILEIRFKAGRVGSTRESRAAALTHIRSTRGAEIWAQTKPLLEGGRCILLEGRPGVGKTTIAQEIAQLAELGRVVLLPNTVLGSPKENHGSAEASKQQQGGTHADTLRMLSPGVIIVDDIDKVHIHLVLLEALRGAAKLVILTANNGKHDDVIDGAAGRAGRIDELFTIEGQEPPRRPPFDQLSDGDWDMVRDWPIAYLNEVERRLLHRPDHLNLKDLAERVEKKTRSGGKLY